MSRDAEKEVGVKVQSSSQLWLPMFMADGELRGGVMLTVTRDAEESGDIVTAGGIVFGGERAGIVKLGCEKTALDSRASASVVRLLWLSTHSSTHSKSGILGAEIPEASFEVGLPSTKLSSLASSCGIVLGVVVSIICVELGGVGCSSLAISPSSDLTGLCRSGFASLDGEAAGIGTMTAERKGAADCKGHSFATSSSMKSAVVVVAEESEAWRCQGEATWVSAAPQFDTLPGISGGTPLQSQLLDDKRRVMRSWSLESGTGSCAEMLESGPAIASEGKPWQPLEPGAEENTDGCTTLIAGPAKVSTTGPPAASPARGSLDIFNITFRSSVLNSSTSSRNSRTAVSPTFPGDWPGFGGAWGGSGGSALRRLGALFEDSFFAHTLPMPSAVMVTPAVAPKAAPAARRSADADKGTSVL
jgi:hypothetical protein